jgi:mRNA interferase YafQ
MLTPIYLNRFEKDLEKGKRRDKDLGALKEVIELLLQEKSLPVKYYNHKLKGNFKGYWECHVEPDWLLLYKKTTKEIIFARLGTHTDLF